jgi:hypothetical protein
MPDPELVFSLLTSHAGYFLWYVRAVGLLEGARQLLRAWDRARKRTPPLHPHAFSMGQALRVLGNSQLATCAMFLYGLSLENLVKAVILTRKCGLPSRTARNRLDWGAKGHDLVELARRAGLRLSEPQYNILKDLTDIIIWKGRYVVPTSPHRLAGDQRRDFGVSIPAWPRLAAMFSQIEAALLNRPPRSISKRSSVIPLDPLARLRQRQRRAAR